DSTWASADPALAFENDTGSRTPPPAYTVQNIDDLSSELSVYFQLTNSTPTSIWAGGLDLLAALGPNWWLPDGFAWGGASGPAADLGNSPVPSALGLFSMGAFQYVPT